MTRNIDTLMRMYYVCMFGIRILLREKFILCVAIISWILLSIFGRIITRSCETVYARARALCPRARRQRRWSRDTPAVVLHNREHHSRRLLEQMVVIPAESQSYFGATHK